MKPKINLIVLAFLLAGCTSDPRAQWAVQNKALSLSERVVVSGNQAGAISDKTFAVAVPYIMASRNALDAADSELAAHKDPATQKETRTPLFDYYLNLAGSAAASLAKIPTTQPVKP